MFKAWPVLTNTIYLIGQEIICVIDTYSFYSSEFLQTYYHYIYFLLMKPPMLHTACPGNYSNFVPMSAQIAFPYKLAS